MTAPIRAVLVDLDDTLYPQARFLELAWRAVADRGAALGVDRTPFLHALRDIAAQGSARGGIIDRALARVGAPTDLVPALVAAFRGVDPERLEPYPGVVDALETLRAKVPVAIVTDGDVTGQRRKVAALDIAHLVDAVVYSDSAGREHRKPHPRPFTDALWMLGVPAGAAVMIGDRPEKDVAGALGVGMRAVRVGTGEYATAPDHPATWRRAATFADAVDGLLPLLPSPVQDQAFDAAAASLVRAATEP
ncbi:haloacid dehalogenase [Pseudonocardia sulfidoxydans NBRC 16205]|uniref:Haloacid dehalogenase n=1 Tax=Pseudonocardia sulfidoxydans NBRC 16205 TaxID=1223511 RepID=A0A511DLE0_9PSEU|nr:HAD-IA family hydrolase [Pseudonocardia sulfidoxydans]GEL25619.1 haloacid dehalogenase [Pseudonocardia sulfidoxydans NBRC 16205]